MTVQFIGVITKAGGQTEPNRFANKHLFILDEGMLYEDMKKEALRITKLRAAGGGGDYKKTFGGTAASKNTVVITNATVYEQMKSWVEEKLTKDDKHFPILVSNGIVMTVNASTGVIENQSDGGAFNLIASARVVGGVKDVYHFTGWTKVTDKKLAEDSELIIPFWMDLHDQQTPAELSPVGLPGVKARA
ncbi:MAG TPA: hypothetical protein VMB71_15565 [Acetobacteraceae bacterium]|nr:hypothetical protein [Acetobacteraceae bacterium]